MADGGDKTCTVTDLLHPDATCVTGRVTTFFSPSISLPMRLSPRDVCANVYWCVAPRGQEHCNYLQPTLTVIPMSVLSGGVSQIQGAHNLAHTFVSATIRAKLRAREIFFSTDWCSQLHMATTAPLPQRHSRRLRGQKPLSPSRQVEKEWSGAWPTPFRGDRPFQGLRPLQNMVYSVWMQKTTSCGSNLVETIFTDRSVKISRVRIDRKPRTLILRIFDLCHTGAMPLTDLRRL